MNDGGHDCAERVRFRCRLPNRPVINTAIVSATVHSEGQPLPPVLDPPITLEYTLLETEERTKPVCVYWDHSIGWVFKELQSWIVFLLRWHVFLLFFLGVGVPAAGRLKAARCSTGTTATLAASVTTWPALQCWWTFPKERSGPKKIKSSPLYFKTCFSWPWFLYSIKTSSRWRSSPTPQCRCHCSSSSSPSSCSASSIGSAPTCSPSTGTWWRRSSSRSSSSCWASIRPTTWSVFYFSPCLYPAACVIPFSFNHTILYVTKMIRQVLIILNSTLFKV